MPISESRRHDCHYERKTDKKFFRCDGCKMKGSGTRFTCNTCGRQLHGECMNHETHINPGYFGCSTLTFREEPLMGWKDGSKQPYYSHVCDACGKDIRGFSYRCGAGKLDLHPCCANLEKKLRIDGTDFNLVSEDLSECKKCHKGKISDGNGNVPGWYYVSTCRKDILHVYCMTEKLHEDRMKDGNSELETMINLIWLFICYLISFFIGQLCKTSISESRGHDCNDHYKLKTYEKHFTCDGCKMKGFGPRYTCNTCGNELHRECRNHNTEINHEYFVGSTFTFLEKPFTSFYKSSQRDEYSKFCDACGKDIGGFSYHCKTGNRDLHPCCRNLKKELVIKHTVFNLGSKFSSKCIWCNKRRISDRKKNFRGWSYVSSCRRYNFHVYCMTEMVQEAYMKHGNSALKEVDVSQLIKTKSNGGSGRTTLGVIKSLLKIVGSVLLLAVGDPTLLIVNVVVESFTGGKQ